MNIRSISFLVLIGSNIGVAIENIAIESDRQGFEILQQEQPISQSYNPSRDKTKTPTSPDVIEHSPRLFGGRNFLRKCIYFGKNENGKPCYQRIWQHESNPEFSNVKLIIYRKANWFRSERFEYIGTYGNESARNKLICSIGSWLGSWFREGKGGLWCPEQNVFIGGTKHKNVCKKYARYIKQQSKPHKIK